MPKNFSRNEEEEGKQVEEEKFGKEIFFFFCEAENKKINNGQQQHTRRMKMNNPHKDTFYNIRAHLYICIVRTKGAITSTL